MHSFKRYSIVQIHLIIHNNKFKVHGPTVHTTLSNNIVLHTHIVRLHNVQTIEEYNMCIVYTMYHVSLSYPNLDVTEFQNMHTADAIK